MKLANLTLYYCSLMHWEEFL